MNKPNSKPIEGAIDANKESTFQVNFKFHSSWQFAITAETAPQQCLAKLSNCYLRITIPCLGTTFATPPFGSAAWSELVQQDKTTSNNTKPLKTMKKEPKDKSRKPNATSKRGARDSDIESAAELRELFDHFATPRRISISLPTVSIDEEWAIRFAENPTVWAVIAYDGEPDEIDEVCAIGNEPFLSVASFDISPLLDSWTSVRVHYGDEFSSGPMPSGYSQTINDLLDGKLTSEQLKARFNDIPFEYDRHMKYYERIKAWGSGDLTEHLVGGAQLVDHIERPLCALPNVIQAWQMGISAEIQNSDENERETGILSHALKNYLNPLTIEISKVRDIPGVRIAHDSDTTFYAKLQKDSFAPQVKNCEPCYVSLQLKLPRGDVPDCIPRSLLAVRRTPLILSSTFATWYESCRQCNSGDVNSSCLAWKPSRHIPCRDIFNFNFCSKFTILLGVLKETTAHDLLSVLGWEIRLHDRDANDQLRKLGVTLLEPRNLPLCIILPRVQHYFANATDLLDFLDMCYSESLKCYGLGDTTNGKIQRWSRFAIECDRLARALSQTEETNSLPQRNSKRADDAEHRSFMESEWPHPFLLTRYHTLLEAYKGLDTNSKCSAKGKTKPIERGQNTTEHQVTGGSIAYESLCPVSLPVQCVDYLAMCEMTLQPILSVMCNPHATSHLRFFRLSSHTNENIKRLIGSSKKFEIAHCEQATQARYVAVSRRERRLQQQRQQLEEQPERANEVSDVMATGSERVDLTNTAFHRTQQRYFEDQPMKESVQAILHGVPRQSMPIKGEPREKLSVEQYLVRSVGDYAEASSRMCVDATLYRSIHATPQNHCGESKQGFQRLVVCLPYKEGGTTVAKLHNLFESVNKKAFPNAQSIYSSQMTFEEKKQIAQGALDVLTGFQVVDDKWRLLVIEGGASAVIAPSEDCSSLPQIKPFFEKSRIKVGNKESIQSHISGNESYKAISLLRELFLRSRPNGAAYKLLDDSTMYFADRLYGSLGLTMKTVRLRSSLTNLVHNHSTYRREKPSLANAHNGLQHLYELRRVERLNLAKLVGCFPTVKELLSIEELYGGTVLSEDAHGPTSIEDKVSITSTLKKRQDLGVQPTLAPPYANVIAPTLASEQRNGYSAIGTAAYDLTYNPPTQSSSRVKSKQKGSLETTNQKYLQLRNEIQNNRPKLDFIRKNKEHIANRSSENTRSHAITSQSYAQRRAIPCDVHDAIMENGGEVHIYSGQAKSVSEIHRQVIRERVTDGRISYTYNPSYNSADFSFVLPEDVVKKGKEHNFRKQISKHEFRVASKPDTNRHQHPKKPSSSRIQDLKERFIDEEEVMARARASATTT